MPKHSRRRAKVVLTESATAQIDAITDPAEIHALDRALAALSVAPELGTPLPGTHPDLREYVDDDEDVRVIFYVTVMKTIIIVAYVES